jgi:hypothetical protein
MALLTLVKRLVKGSALTHQELDDNFTLIENSLPRGIATPPTLGDFAWINQSTATVTAQADGTILMLGVPSSLTSVNMLKKAAPATPYSITMMMVPLFTSTASNPGVGLGWRESSSGKIAGAIYYANAGLYSTKYTNPTTFSADYTALLYAKTLPAPILLKIEDTGVNRNTYFSPDMGSNWLLSHSVARTDFLTGNEVGFFTSSNTANSTPRMFLMGWKEE